MSAVFYAMLPLVEQNKKNLTNIQYLHNKRLLAKVYWLRKNLPEYLVSALTLQIISKAQWLRKNLTEYLASVMTLVAKAQWLRKNLTEYLASVMTLVDKVQWLRKNLTEYLASVITLVVQSLVEKVEFNRIFSIFNNNSQGSVVNAERSWV